ncbi:MAG: HAMP domain-containing histidine kinase [Acidobacteria bacterium]|nr:HAMP domain-containing histidine kinase [Acidobacteriota bacterium]
MSIRPRRLRTSVTIVAFAMTFAIMSIAAIVMVAFSHRQLIDAVDVSLEESIDEASSELGVSFGRTRFRGLPGPGPRALGIRVRDSTRSLQLINESGTVVSASRSVAEEPALVDPTGEVQDGEFSTVDGLDERYRVASTELQDGLTLVAAYSLVDVDESLTTQRRALILGIPLLSGLLGVLIWFVLGRALKPVEDIREQVAAIGHGRLDQRVPVPSRSVELAALASTMNDMLERLDSAAQRQDRFVSDAAHELRSPLTGIRSQLEVNIAHPDAGETSTSQPTMLVEAIRMQDLVDDLLALAREDQVGSNVSRVELDLDDIVIDVADQLRLTSSLDVDISGVSAARVRGDATQLRRVLRNLADNAGRHARTRVECTLSEVGTVVRFVISDDGPGISPDDAETVFDRFTRLDESRARDAGGSGLGLAISREILERHGGTIVLDTTYESGARFVLELPRALS